ncbi:MAG TPA: DHA2 family efflux MFS transporter permease subunit [Gemmatimonadaceae bacterium]|nr:DHA2 family efflux MFS transporter permease subunit [Gemmatimonadaceae bacterium]
MMPESAPDNHKWLVLTTIGVGTFMSALDGSVVNTILPVLSHELHAGIATIEWVTTVYLLVVSGLLLSVGRAGDLYGHKQLYLGGFVLFVIGSALCGMAESARALIALRGVQALGAAALFATAPAILTRSFPPTQRGRAFGALGTFTYLGLAVGPSLGGWLTGAFSWRAVFYINVPVGVLAILMATRTVQRDRVEQHDETFDLAGAALFTVGLVALMFALNQGHVWGWTGGRTLGMLASSAMVLGLFIAVERRRSHPMLDLTLFRSRVFSGTTLSAVLNYASVYSLLFVLPFLLIQGRGLTPQRAGLVLTAQPIVMAIVAPFSGALSDKVGTRVPAVTGMLLLALGLTLEAFAVANGTLTTIALCLAIVGLGVGVFVSPNNSALMGAAPRHRQGIASGVLATARNVGMVLGVGVAGAVFTTLASSGLSPAERMVPGVRGALLVAAFMAVVGAVTSALR